MRASRGFTLVELITVMILIGIVAVSIAPKLGDLKGDQDVVYLNEFEARLRLVQEIAMNSSGSGCAVAVISNSGFWHQELSDCADGRTVPASSSSSAHLKETVFDSAMNVDGKSNRRRAVMFDHLGSVRSCLDGSATADLTIKTSSQDCSISFGSRGASIKVGVHGHIQRQ